MTGAGLRNAPDKLLGLSAGAARRVCGLLSVVCQRGLPSGPVSEAKLSDLVVVGPASV